MKNVVPWAIFLLALTVLIGFGCFRSPVKQEVVVYTSVDQVYSSRILKQFEQETDIAVKAVYDAEASKAVGLEQRLVAEKAQPKADVFWNSEFMRTARLAAAGVFSPSLRAAAAPGQANATATGQLWHALGARSRVFLVNTDILQPEDYPRRLEDLLVPAFRGRAAVSTPFAGSTSTHFAALYHALGEQGFSQFLRRLKGNEVAFLAGNSVVKDAVGHGKYAFGLVDTDDALVGREQGLPVELVYYDQNGKGVFSFFQTVSRVKNGPNPENAAKLIAYLVSEKVEKELISMKAVQFPLLGGTAGESGPVMWTAPPVETLAALEPSVRLLREHLQ